MKFRDFLDEAIDIVDTGKKGKEFENKFIKALQMVGLKFDTNNYAGRMWDIKPIGAGWQRIVTDKQVNIKVTGTKWMFGTSELYKLLPWEKLPDDYNTDKAAAKVKRFLNKKGLSQIVYLKPKDKGIQTDIISAVDQKDVDKLEKLLVKKNFYIEKLGKSYQVRVLSNKERVTSVAIDKGGKVFMRSEKPRSMQGTMMVTFRTPTTKLGKAIQKPVKTNEGVKMSRLESQIIEDELVNGFDSLEETIIKLDNVEKYVKRIRNENKKIYASEYFKYLKGESGEPEVPSSLTFLDAQNVRINLQEITEGLMSEAPIKAKGWTQASVAKFGKTIGKDPQAHGFFDSCVSRMEGKKGFDGDKAKRFCASIKDASYGSAFWRGKDKPKKDIESDVKEKPFPKQLKKGKIKEGTINEMAGELDLDSGHTLDRKVMTKMKKKYKDEDEFLAHLKSKVKTLSKKDEIRVRAAYKSL